MILIPTFEPQQQCLKRGLFYQGSRYHFKKHNITNMLLYLCISLTFPSPINFFFGFPHKPNMRN